MIRPARHADIPALVEMGRRFHAVAGWAETAQFSPGDFAGLLDRLIDGEEGLLLVAGEVPVGMAAGLIYPCYYNNAVLVGQELFWWVEPEHRTGLGMRLFRALETEARAKGASSFSMGCLNAVDPDRMANVYRRAGYRLLEHIWQKRF